MTGLRAALFALLAQVVSPVGAFVAPLPRWQGGEGTSAATRQPVQAAVSTPATFSSASSSPGLSKGAMFAGAALAGALASIFGGRKKEDHDTKIGMRGWDRLPAPPQMEHDGDPSRGPSYRTWINLKRRATKGNGKRQRFFRQQRILAESGITCAKGGYHLWYPNRDQHNLYKGPESHPDNPDFPAASGGYRALVGWAPAPLTSSAPRGGHRGAVFAGARTLAPSLGSAKRCVPAVRRGLVLKAHKKAASSTRNQGHKNNPKFWGLTKKAHQGCAVKAGQLLVRQKGMNWYPGANVVKGKDFSLHSLKSGIVQWRGEYKHREIFVVPWEYVKEKCMWINPNTLSPKVYEPWMGVHNWGKRHHILKLRKEWLQTDDGKAWLEKKTEKKEKQKAIQAKIREHRRLKMKGELPGKGDEPVAAGAASESEGEA